MLLAMNWSRLVINMLAIFLSVFIYSGIMRTDWGKQHEDIHYVIMLLSLGIGAVAAGMLGLMI